MAAAMLVPSSALAARSGVSLTARAGAGQYRGWLTGEAPAHASAQLLAQSQVPLEDPQAPLPPADEEPGASEASRSALQAEYDQLEADNPDLFGPIAMEIGGEVAAVVGYIFGVAGLALSASTRIAYAPALAIGGGILFSAGVAVAIVAAVLIVKAVIARSRRMRRMNELEEQLRAPPPPPEAPEVPAQVRWEGSRLEPRLTLARF